MANYRIEMYKFEELKERMTIPKYQRPLVWSVSQKAAFIDNISKGYPFGSLLLYRYDNDEKFSLIDGQQRYNTLLEYQSSPGLYFPVETECASQVSELLGMCEADTMPDEPKAKTEAILLAAIKDLLNDHSSGEKPEAKYLAKRLTSEIPALKGNIDSALRICDIQQELIDLLDSYVCVSEIQIPCVIFTGDKSELPEVFANVNLGGKKLTKYQVFAAQWNRYTVNLSSKKYSNNILETTITRYEALTEEREGLEIEDFSASEMRREREVTLPEFCHALGVEIINTCPAFWPSKTLKQDDTVDTIGYNTLAICFGIKPTEIAGKKGVSFGLPDKFASAEFDNSPERVEELITAIVNEYEEINGRFAKHLRKPGNKEQFETGRSSVILQFLSFFAALWRLKFGPIGERPIKPIEGYRKKGYSDSVKNLFRCFMLDMLNNQWKGSGDSRLGNYVDGTLTYYGATSYSEAKMTHAIDTYIEEIESKASINADPTAKTIVTVLANTHPNQYKESTYDFEHLISRETLRTKVQGKYAYQTYGIAGGCLGNIALLSDTENRSKGSTPIPNCGGELFIFHGEREYIESPQELCDADIAIRNGKSAEEAKRFMHKRALLILEELKRLLSEQ